MAEVVAPAAAMQRPEPASMCDRKRKLAACASLAGEPAPKLARSASSGASSGLLQALPALQCWSPQLLEQQPLSLSQPSCGADCSSDADCSSSAVCAAPPLSQQQQLQRPPASLMQHPVADMLALVQQQKQLLMQQVAGPALLEQLLERALSETDSALHITLDAMTVATQLCAGGSAEAADRALEFAEQALAVTVQWLAKAQALVVRRVQQAGGTPEEDEELRDTCSSAPEGPSSA